MTRQSTALSLSLSMVSLGLATFAVVRNPRDDLPEGVWSERRVREMQQLVASLQEKVEVLEARQDEPRESFARPSRVSRPEARVPAPTGQADLQEQIAGLARRLATLEDGETIARLAQTGDAKLVKRKVRGTIDRFFDPEVSPQERLNALKTIRGMLKSRDDKLVAEVVGEFGVTELDFVMPVLEFARDTTLGADLRTDAVRSLIGTKLDEVRQPLLDLLAYDAVPEVRGEAMHALMYHLDEPAVRDAITLASRQDPHEEVREQAESYLPKVEHFAQMAAKADGAAGAGREK